MLDIFECVNDNALKSVVADYFIQLTGDSQEEIFEISRKTEDVVDLMGVVYGDTNITLRQLAFVCEVTGIPMVTMIGNNPDFSLEDYFISGHCITKDEYVFLEYLSELSKNDENAYFDIERKVFVGKHMSEVLTYLNFQSENYDFLASDEDLNSIDEALRLKEELLTDSAYTTSDVGYSYVKKYRLLTKQQQGRLMFYMDRCIEKLKLEMKSSEEASTDV